MRLSLERFISFLTVLLAAFAMAQLAGAAPLPDSRTEGSKVARQQIRANCRDVFERRPTFRAGLDQSPQVTAEALR